MTPPTQRRRGDATAVPSLGQVFGALDGAGVVWALLRGHADLGANVRDVDLLVSGDDIEAAEDVIFALGGVRLPLRMHPWHQFYVFGDPESGRGLKLDVVTTLIYGRERRLVSGLETGCLERRIRRDDCFTLEPTDLFWTLLLHCVLDKRSVNERRQAEIDSVAAHVRRPSPGEEVFDRICPPLWSAERALQCALAQDWEALATFDSPPASPTGPRSPASGRFGLAGDGLVASSYGVARRAARAGYPFVWRGVGLGANPRVLQIADAERSDALVVRLTRKPGRREVVLVLADDQAASLTSRLRRERYVSMSGAWVRPTVTGLERVRVISAGEAGQSSGALGALLVSSTPMHGHSYCRRASPVVAASVLAGQGHRLAGGHREA